MLCLTELWGPRGRRQHLSLRAMSLVWERAQWGIRTGLWHHKGQSFQTGWRQMHDIAVPSIETTHRVLYLCTYVRASRFWWIVLTQNFTAAVVCSRLCEMFFAYCFEKDTDVGGSQRKHECVLRMKVLFLALNEAVRFACVVTSSRCRSACSNLCFKSSFQSAARSHSPSGLISGETEGCVTPLWSHHCCCFVFF